MPRCSDLIGLPVLTGQEMKRIGRIREVLLSRDGSRISGLVLDGGGLFRQRRTLDFRAVRMVGATHVLAEESYLASEAGTCGGDSLHGLPVLDRTGEELGLMDDIHFDPSSGRVVALQLSRGFVDDLLGGKDVVAVQGPLLAGQAAIMLAEPGESSGGIQA